MHTHISSAPEFHTYAHYFTLNSVLSVNILVQILKSSRRNASFLPLTTLPLRIIPIQIPETKP